jgi:hypothetical protein
VLFCRRGGEWRAHPMPLVASVSTAVVAGVAVSPVRSLMRC